MNEGTQILVATDATNKESDAGALRLNEGTNQDVTRRKQAEARSLAFSSLGRRLSSASTAREAAQIIVDTADHIFGWDNCHVRLFKPERDSIVPVLAYDIIDGQRQALSSENESQEMTPMMRYVMEHGAQLVNDGSAGTPSISLLSFGDTSRRSASRIFVPLRREGNLLGFLSIQSYRPGAYTQDDVQLLEALADHCSGALERIKTAELLRESEQRFRGMFQFAPIGIAVRDRHGNIVMTNRAYQEMLGYSNQELCLRGVEGVTHPHDISDTQRYFEELVMGTRDFYRKEKRYIHKNGSEVWVEVSASAIRDETGKLSNVISMVDDITKRKLAESQIVTLAHAVQSTSEPICITDLEDRFTFINRAFKKIYGYSEAEILGKKPDILFSERNPAALMREILENTRTGGWQGEVIDKRKDGTEFPVFLSTSEIKDEKGKVLGLMGVAQDITERRRAEAQIRLLADAVQSAQELISVTDHDNRITFVNQAFLDTYGYTESEILGRTPEFLYSPSNPKGLCDQVYTQTLSGGWQGEILNQRKDGSDFSISLSTSLIKDAMGKTVGLVGVAQDITMRKRLEQEVIEISTTERRSIGHELHDGLGQYLAGISLKAKVLEEDLSAENHPLSAKANQLVGFLKHAIGQTRALAQGLDPIQVEANGLVAALEHLAKQSSDLFQVNCKFFSDREVLPINVSAALALYRIAQEAIRNAAVHGNAKHIHLELSVEAVNVCLRIRDQGSGFPSDPQKTKGMGLHIMQYRAKSIGGGLKIGSKRGAGVEIECFVPTKLCAPSKKHE